MLLADKWLDYKILDAGNGLKLENIAGFLVSRPDAQVIWEKSNSDWKNLDAIYHRSDRGGGYWQYNKKPDSNFIINYQDLSFNIEFTSFKHIGLFPEQAVNWEFIIQKIREKNRTDIKALNLFAYTGGATVACAKAGANEVVHVDASKKIVASAKKNISINNLDDITVRFIIEDVMKFVLREIRRGRKYDVIIMDPPVYGRGPNGELWEIESSLTRLVSECVKLLSDNPVLFLINCYTANFSHISLKNVLFSHIKHDGYFYSDEIGIPIENSNLILPCGITARFFT